MSFGSSATPPPLPPAAGPWQDRAACIGHDPELWFADTAAQPGPQPDHYRLTVVNAKAICRRCEVRDECLAFCLETGQTHGIWGGRTERDRRADRLAANARVHEHGTHHGYNAHIRRREQACEPCKTAHAQYTQKLREARR